MFRSIPAVPGLTGQLPNSQQDFMMPPSIARIDPHQATFAAGIIDGHGVEIVHDTFANNASGFCVAIEVLTTHGVETAGVEGSASWGARVARRWP
jgi:hypothetical protein